MKKQKRKDHGFDLRKTFWYELAVDCFKLSGWLLKRLPRKIKESYLALVVAALTLGTIIILALLASDKVWLWRDWFEDKTDKEVLQIGNQISWTAIALSVLLIGLPIIIGLAMRLKDWIQDKRRYYTILKEIRQANKT